MKKLLILTLVVILLINCGCSIIDNSEAQPDSYVEKTEEPTVSLPESEKDQEFQLDIFNEPYQAIEREGRVVLYQNTVYYECDPQERSPWQPHIYAVGLSGESAAEDLLNGELVMLCGSVLIGRTETNYCAMDLADPVKKWKSLQASATETAHFEYQNQLILFSSREEKNYVDCIDLQTLESTRTEIPMQITQAVVSEDELIYVCRDDQGYFLCSASLSDRKETVLERIEVDFTPIVSKEQILLCREKYNPMVYDRKTEKVSILRDLKSEGKYDYSKDIPYAWECDGSTIYFRYYDGEQQKVWAYDIEKTKAVNGEEYLEKNHFGEGNYYKIANRKLEFFIGEQVHSIEVPNGMSPSNFAANEFGVAFLDDTCLFFKSFDDNEEKMLAHYEQVLTKE